MRARKSDECSRVLGGDEGSISPGERIPSLDAIRGIAVLGILTMNVVSYGLGTAPFYNVAASSPQEPLDWFIGGFGEIFFDQKFMGLFSMLFGASIVLFADRAAGKGRRPVLLSLWRNSLLLLIGIAHTALWEGDVLLVYALCAPLIIALRNVRSKVLVIAGLSVMMIPLVFAVAAQATVSATYGLGEYWGVPGEISYPVYIWMMSDFSFRALGMMLVGVAAYRSGFLTGANTATSYRRAAQWGLGLGLPLTVIGFAFVVLNDFGARVAIIGSIPNSIATLPIVLGYASLIILWIRRSPTGWFVRRILSVGRMALTNYLAQTMLGVTVLYTFFFPSELSRTSLALFVFAVWALQLWWSDAWLARYRYGPVEWVWRSLTYRNFQRNRRSSDTRT